MSTVLTIGPRTGKLHDLAADPLGWIVVYQDESHGDLMFLQLHPDGSRRVADVRIPAGGGNAFPRLYVDALKQTWLAWRHEQRGGLLLNVTVGEQVELGPVYGNNPVALGYGVVVYQRADGITISRRVLSQPGVDDINGHFPWARPTGVAYVDSFRLPVLVDNNRDSVPGLVNPSRARGVVVGENAGPDPPRAIARLDDGREVVLWTGEISFTPRVAVRAE